MESQQNPRTVLCAIFPFVAVGLLNGFYIEYLYSLRPGFFWAADILQFVLIPGVSVWLLYKYAHIGPWHYGFVPGGRRWWITTACWSLLLVILCWPLLDYLVNRFQELFPASRPTFTFHSVMPEEPTARFLVAIYFALTAGIVEEAFYRGLLLAYWQRSAPLRLVIPGYILSSSLLFGGIHWEYGFHYVLATFCFGLVWSFLYGYLRNIWPFVIAHAATDFFSFYR